MSSDQNPPESELNQEVEHIERLIKDSQFREAIAILESILVDDPENKFALSRIGFAYRKVGEYQKCVDVLEKYCSFDIECSYQEQLLADAYNKVGRYDDASRLAQKVLKTNQDNQYCKNLIRIASLRNSRELITQGNDDAGIQILDSALSSDPENVYALESYAYICNKKCDYIKTIRIFEKHYHILKSNYPNAVYYLINAYLGMNRYSDVIRFALDALETWHEAKDFLKCIHFSRQFYRIVISLPAGSGLRTRLV